MDALEAIFTRRSIRKYSDRAIGKEEEEILLKAAMSAPNTVNTKAWAFVVVRDKEKLNALSQGLFPNGQCLKDASMAIIVCGDMLLTRRGLEDYWQQDCSNATMNLLIASHALGIGAVWLGVYPDGKKVANIAKELHLPRHIIPLCVVSMGYPAETRPIDRPYYEPHKIHYESWEE